MYLQHKRFVVSGAPTARLALRRLFPFFVGQPGPDEVDLDERTKHAGRRPHQRVGSHHCSTRKIQHDYDKYSENSTAACNVQSVGFADSIFKCSRPGLLVNQCEFRFEHLDICFVSNSLPWAPNLDQN